MKALLIRNGLIVNATGRIEADVLISEGKISAVGEHLALPPDVETIDAGGLHLLPGGIDPHVHLAPFIDDFESGSRAALAGGITTLGVMCFPRPDESMEAMLARNVEEAGKHSRVDVVLHSVLNVHRPPELEALGSVIAAGQTTCKVFTMLGEFDLHYSAYVELLHRARSMNLMVMFHCEDQSVLQESARALKGRRCEHVAFYEKSRPVLSEELAVHKVLALCELTECPVYIVHVSSERALAACAAAQRRGLPVYVETRPIYLHLDATAYESSNGVLFVSFPPIRSAQDSKALWNGLADGAIHTVGSDHAPLLRAQKVESAHCVLCNPRPGMSNLQEMLPVLYSEGVRKRRITLERFVRVTATNAAKLLGLYPQKGLIAVGADADITIWDPEGTLTIRASEGHSNADFSVYEGWTVTGVPRVTIRRGEILYRDGQFLASERSGGAVLRTPPNLEQRNAL